MSATPPVGPVLDEQEVPPELWWFGWSFVGIGLVQLLVQGAKDDLVSAVVSMGLSALVVAFFAAGVVRARGVRLGVVATLVGLLPVLAVVALVYDPTALGALEALVSGLQAWLLWRYTRTPWFAWQRTMPTGGPSLAPILAVAVLAGVLGGLKVTQEPQPGFTVNLSVAGTPH